MKTITFIIILIISLVSCKPKVLFINSMPPVIDALTEIPAEFQGVFICESDSARIYSERKVIYEESYYEFTTTLDKIEETEHCSVVAGGLYLPGRKECLPFKYLNEDTIVAQIYEIDTLFDITKDEVAKLYKGRLFLNLKSAQHEWVTFMITPQLDGSMLWEIITIPDSIKDIENVSHDYYTKMDKDSVPQHILNPTLMEFDKIIDKNYTRKFDYLIPVNFERLPFY